jgi:acetyltransferase-like isoleucine patch superfamily enzyme
MKFYRLKTGRKLYGFGDLLSDVPVVGRTLAETQKHAIVSLGHELFEVDDIAKINDERFCIFDDDLVFSRDFVKGVAAKIKSNPTLSMRFILAANSFNERFCLPRSKQANEDLKFNFFYQSKPLRHSHQLPIETVVEQRVYENHVSVPKQIVREGFYHYDQCSVFIAQIISPFHLLHANLAFLFLRYIGLRTLLPESITRKFFPTYSRFFFLALKSRNKIGKGCRIHSTAVLEGCEIGDNVTIGAYSVVRLSRIGSGSTLEEHTLVKYSVLGKDCYVSNGNQINACMAYDEAFLIHGPYQFSIFGNQSTVMAVINCDYRLDQKTIQIETSYGRLDSRQPLLGIAYGHGAKIGGGNIILPGRTVPNDHHLPPPGFTKVSFEKSELRNADL